MTRRVSQPPPPGTPDLAALLQAPFGEVLARVLAANTPTASSWIDIRDEEACPVPYRHVLAAAQRGELKAHKIGRRALVRRDELDAWIASQPTLTGSTTAEAPKPATGAELILARNGWRKTA